MTDSSLQDSHALASQDRMDALLGMNFSVGA
jgi:hypothetical protein